MSRPVIHQVILGAADGDAITRMAISLRNELRQFADSEIYAWIRHGEKMEQEVRSLSDIAPSEDIDILVYHSSIGFQEMTDFLMSRAEKIVISYHNITPAHFYEQYQPDFARDLRLGREELKKLKSKTVLAIADSTFNANDLAQYGYRDVHVIPAGLTPSRLCNETYDVDLVAELSREFPNGYVIAVGQVLPHKRIERIIETMHIMNSTHWGNVGLVICGIARQAEYMEALTLFERRCAMVRVHFTGPVTDQQLSTCLRASRAYVGMSDHEGLCIPPVEAMSLGIPVVIKGAGAIPETMGAGALVLPADAGPILASEALHAVLTEDELRWSLIDAGFERVKELENRTSTYETASLLKSVLS